jgi:hypothetical protein
MLLRIVIAAARLGEKRDRRIKVDWVPLTESSSMFDLLMQIQMYKWPIPRDTACFHPDCDHILTDSSSHHLQKEHNRKRPMTIGKDAKPRVHNGESALQATTADLLNVWAIAEAKAKYPKMTVRKLLQHIENLLSHGIPRN